MSMQEPSQVLSAEARTSQRDEAAAGLVNALLLINGGGAVALLAFAQAVLNTHRELVRPVAISILLMSIGAALAAAFHLFRYQASWYHQGGERSAWAKFRRLYLVSSSVSIACFVLGMLYVAIKILAVFE